MDTTVVLTNWKRPQNLPQIIEAFRSQTNEPAEILLVDNSPSEEFRFQSDDLVDDVVRFSKNAGPCCRFVAIPLLKTPLVLFYDDDLLPGSRCIEHLYNQAEQLDWKFSSIGEIGRRYKSCRRSKKWSIKVRNVRRKDSEPTGVDMLCRAHFVQTLHLHHALDMRARAILAGASEAELRHDDIFLSQGIQAATGFKSYLTANCDQDRRLKHHDLPAPEASNAREEHRVSRNRLVNICAEKGNWKSVR